MMNINLNEYFKKQKKISGNVLFSKNNKIIFNESYGYSNKEKGIKNTPQTKFMIGSMTKAITALCIMQLSEKGMLSIQQNIEDYIPDFYKGHGITIHHLLTHTSGIPNYIMLKKQIKWGERYTPQDLKEIVNIWMERKMNNLKLQKFIPVIITIPSITLGAIAMFHNEISTLIWTQNIACLVVAGLISHFIILNKWNIKASKYNDITIIIAFLFLFLTFLDPGMNGVHRWISIGIMKFNVSMILLPLIIIALWRASQTKGLWFTLVIALAISILLAIQPDASQLTGFAAPMMILLCSKMNGKISRLFIMGIFLILVILSWVFLDSLPAVIYVERIISLLNNMGFVWLTLGVISLAILPVPFILFPPKNLKLPSICVGLYFTIILISTIFGNFPVPLMGYGISPIIGYFIPITWYTEFKVA